MPRSTATGPRNRLLGFLSNNAWAGIAGIVAVLAIVISVYSFIVDRKQDTANIDYWVLSPFTFSIRLPSGEMSRPTRNALLVGIRNNGPKAGEGVLVTIQSGEQITCTEIGAGLMLADTQTPTRSSASPFLCEYYYDYLYSEYYLFFLVYRQSDVYSVSITVTGSNVRVTNTTSEVP